MNLQEWGRQETEARGPRLSLSWSFVRMETLLASHSGTLSECERRDPPSTSRSQWAEAGTFALEGVYSWTRAEGCLIVEGASNVVGFTS